MDCFRFLKDGSINSHSTVSPSKPPWWSGYHLTLIDPTRWSWRYVKVASSILAGGTNFFALLLSKLRTHAVQASWQRKLIEMRMVNSFVERVNGLLFCWW